MFLNAKKFVYLGYEDLGDKLIIKNADETLNSVG